MKIVVNGDARDLQHARDIPSLLEELGLPSPSVLVEHNGVALRRGEWPGRPIEDGDRLEIIRIVAGG